MYDAIVKFIGTPPAGLEELLYLACIPFTMFLVSEFYAFLRVITLRLVDKIRD